MDKKRNRKDLCDTLKAGEPAEAFSYFVIHDDKVSGADNVLFSVPVFITTLRDINV